MKNLLDLHNRPVPRHVSRLILVVGLVVLSASCREPSTSSISNPQTLSAERQSVVSGQHPQPLSSERQEVVSGRQRVVKRSPALRFGTHFLEASPLLQQAPTLRDVPLPKIPFASAIWGATGRDDAGNVYFGVSLKGNDTPSAHLLRLDFRSGDVSILGDAVSELKRHGIWRDAKSQVKIQSNVRESESGKGSIADGVLSKLKRHWLSRGGESQMKIHGKICQANDGMVYFASMDERGENEDGSAWPIWGGHLWRMRPQDGKWEHLLTTPEALIALGTTGRYVYALGYFNHAVYQFDSQTGNTESVVVGSADGHVSRNLIVDQNEHVYVPRVEETEQPSSDDPAVNLAGTKYLRSSLVEYDTTLREVQSVLLPDYEPTGNARSLGIVGFATLGNGEVVFTTQSGAFWRITPHEGRPATIERLGWFHPDGRSFTPSLFCPSGERYVCGLARCDRSKPVFQWTVYDLEDRVAVVRELDPASRELLGRPGLLVYGTNTLDDQGNGYLVGWVRAPGGTAPHAMRVQWTAAAETGNTW